MLGFAKTLLRPVAPLALAAVLALPAAGAMARDGVTTQNAPQVSERLTEQGETAREAGKIDEAIALYEMAVTAYPRNARAFRFLGQAYESQDEIEYARKYYGIALEISPDDAATLLLDGKAAIAEEDIKTARERLEQLNHACGGRCPQHKTLSEAVKAEEARIEAEETGDTADDDGN